MDLGFDDNRFVPDQKNSAIPSLEWKTQLQQEQGKPAADKIFLVTVLFAMARRDNVVIFRSHIAIFGHTRYDLYVEALKNWSLSSKISTCTLLNSIKEEHLSGEFHIFIAFSA